MLSCRFLLRTDFYRKENVQLLYRRVLQHSDVGGGGVLHALLGAVSCHCH